VDREVGKILWAETIIYITPIMWFNMPAPMVKWLDEVLLYEKTFIITEEYGEGGQVPADKFMIVTTSNLKSSDLGKGFVLKNAPHIDDLLRPLIYTNTYLSIRDQIPTFHASFRLAVLITERHLTILAGDNVFLLNHATIEIATEIDQCLLTGDEYRFLSIGRSRAGNLLVVSYTERKQNLIRIISARKATRQELKYYEQKQ
jgi:uncharacterized DUF497 family protein